MRADLKSTTGRRWPGRLFCGAGVQLLGALLVAGLAAQGGRCVQPPKGLPGRDAAARKAEAHPASTAAGRLDAAALSRLARLKGVRRVRIITLSGPVDSRLVATLRRELARVPAAEVALLELDAAGGEAGAARQARRIILGAKVPVIAWVRGSATGEAALLALASNLVVMAPGARLGAMGPSQFSRSRRGKAALVALFAATAAARGRSAAWARAMVSPPGGEAVAGATAKAAPPAGGSPAPKKVPEKGKLVSLTASAARGLGFSEGVAADPDGLARLLGLTGAELVRGGKVVRRADPPGGVASSKRIDPKKLLSQVKRIVVVHIGGMVELGMLSFVQRTIGQTGPHDLVIIDVDTLGGRVDAAIRIRDTLLRAKGKTLAFINPRAISAGALISLACDVIFMRPGGSIGAATPITISGGKASPVGEKYVSYMRKEMKATAEAKGRRGDLAEAMVDMSVEVKNVPPALKESISGLKKGKLLTLTTDEALALGMVEGRASSFDDLTSQLGLGGLPVSRPTETWAERLSRVLISPTVSGILMMLGLLLLFLEARTPGFGAAGILGLACLLTVVFGHKIAGLGGWEPLLLFILGVVLLVVELFVTPGFGLLGGMGILAVVGSLIWALIGAGGIPLSISWDQGYVTSALARVFGVIALTAAVGTLLVWLLPKAPGPLGRLALGAVIDGDASAGAHDLPEGVGSRDDLVGLSGVTATALRPTGKVKIGSKRLEVVSRGGYVDAGVEVEVVSVQGRRIVVREVSS